MNMGHLAHSGVINLRVFSVSMFMSGFFSFRNTRAENAGKLPVLMEGRERAGRNTWGANSSGSRAMQVIKPAGYITEGMVGTGQVERAPFQGIPLLQCCFPECGALPSTGWGERVHPARGSLFSVGIQTFKLVSQSASSL